MKSGSLLLKNANIITFDTSKPYISNGDILIDGGLIKAIGVGEKTDDSAEIDCAGKLVMPGFINAHTHLYSALARGIPIPGAQPSNFVQNLEKLWWKLDLALDEESLYYSALVGLMDSLRCGVTTVFDHNASPGFISGSLNTIAKAVQGIGLRACLSYEVTDRNGPEGAESGIEENVNFIEYCGEKSPELLRASFGLHASLTLSNKTLRECEYYGTKLKSGFHVHVAEDKADVDDCITKYSKRVVERLNDFEILGPKTLAIHCVHVSEDEIDILDKTRTNMIHNPESNMKNGVGYAPVLHMMEKGLKVHLGTDGYSPNMAMTVRTANLLPKLVFGDPRKGTDEVRTIFSRNNPRLASEFWGKPVGKIQKGAAADIIIVNYEPPTPLDENNWWFHFLFGVPNADVETVIVNGNIVMKDRKILSINESKILTESKIIAKNLWERFVNE
ncbi:putative aminohydrolase SsnA [bacterium]|nr:putative aminohydrolase SsnA [bacterium]